MIKITVNNINFGEKEFTLKTGTIRELIDKLETNNDSVIFTDDSGHIYTKDRKIKDGAKINVIEVFSGG